MTSRAGAILLLLAFVLAGPSEPVGAAEPIEATITYLTSSSAYVDAGTRNGLVKGSVVSVVRDGTVVTTLEVTALSSRRAACARTQTDLELFVGDRVTYVPEPHPVGAVAAERVDVPSIAVPSVAETRREPRLQGRLGFRYLGFTDDSGLGENYAQPGLDVRLEASSILDQVDVSADVRSRRTYRTLTDGTGREDGRTRVYRLLGRWRPSGGPVAVTVGRQVSAHLASVSIFDGVAAAYEGDRWSLGGFGGTQPGLDDYGFSDRIREYGVWLGRRGADAGARWSVTAGFVGSYDGNALDREYFVLQGRLNRRVVSIHATQEIDVARGWKSESESFLSPTSTLLGARWNVRDDLSLDGGFDTRRAVRLHRHRITPETEFDDSFRRGMWGGARFTPTAHSSLALSVRRSTGGSAGAATATTATLRLRRPSLHGVSATLRSTRYLNARAHGWLHSVTAGASPGARIHSDITVGFRNERDPRLLSGHDDLRWIALDLDARISRGWYALISAERSHGETEDNRQTHVSVVYRF